VSATGLKYLHKIQQKVDRENVNPHINIQRPTSSRLFPPKEDYELLEKKVECKVDREYLDEKITPALMIGKDSGVPSHYRLMPQSVKSVILRAPELYGSITINEEELIPKGRPILGKVNPFRQKNSNLGVFSFVLDKSPYAALGSRPLQCLENIP
jgi:hypothetical protein